MDSAATRPHPIATQTGQPLQAKPCRCDEPVGDLRDMTCLRCGHQIGGVPLPSTRKAAPALGDHSTPARKGRRHRPAQ